MSTLTWIGKEDALSVELLVLWSIALLKERRATLIAAAVTGQIKVEARYDAC